MTRARAVWTLGVVALALAAPAALAVASVLPFGYDFRAYWLAAQHLTSGAPMYPALDAPLGQADEYHYLPLVAAPFALLLPLPIGEAAWIWLAAELGLAIGVGIALMRPLPSDARPWAAAGYVFFLPMVLELTLGNVNVLCLALALLAWRWRDRPNASAVALAAAVGIKFLPLVLLPFYLAAGYGRIVVRALGVGVAALLVTLPFLWTQTVAFVELWPRYVDLQWVRLHAQREDPPWLAAMIWTDLFSLALALAAIGLAVLFGRNARRDRARETDWHHLALAIAPYVTPFGFVWTTFLITSLPLFSITLARALRMPFATRAPAILGLVLSWAAMLVVQLREIWPLAAHFAGVAGLVTIALVLMAIESRQALGRSSPLSRATRAASG